VQRISRQRQYKTRVENVSGGWSRLLINALLVLAVENAVRTFWSPTAELALQHTDPTRNTDGRLFTRIYDAHVRELLEVDRQGEWWRIDVRRNQHRAVLPEKRREVLDAGKVICICHDIERGIGHIDCDPDFARAVDGPARKALDRMLDLESRAGVRCTYNIVGTLFQELRDPITRRGHSVAFHSHDHRIRSTCRPAAFLNDLGGRLVSATGLRPRNLGSAELHACRLLDRRIKGYRPPQSRLNRDLSDAHLAYHNFEWLASSASSLGRSIPGLENGIVTIPIHLDDYPLYTGRQTFSDWATSAVEMIGKNDFTAIGLHDCYAGWWLDGYAELLNSLRGSGTLLTFDEVAARVFLANSL
jgi:peptidoglycan/xylan/chitin deacetylase (PgdA/CDA1 family)